MEFRNRILYNTLNQYDEIIIYGTGDYAQKIYPLIRESDLKNKIICFSQSDKGGVDFIDEKPIVAIKEVACNREECVVLIAVSEKYLYEIKQVLFDYGFLNIVSLVDYRIDHIQSEKRFDALMTFEEYCESIAEWYVKTHIGKQDKETIFQELVSKGYASSKKRDIYLIVMISGHLSPRTIKLIRALRKRKYVVVLLKYGGKVNPWCSKTLQRMDVNIYECQCIEELLYQALEYNPLVYFFEPAWGDCLWAKIMLKNKFYFGKIVLALYDVLNDGYNIQENDKLASEKYALEYADGIVWRWFSKDYLREKGFEYRGKSIQFIDYCSYETEEIITCGAESSVIKLCAIAGYGDEYVEDRGYANQYIEWARIGEILDKIGNREDCIFHFYAGFLSKKNIARCEQYEKDYKNFRFFLATEYNELLQKLRSYDFGCEFWTAGEETSDGTIIGDYYGSIYRNSIRNGYFDFLGAGLPIITTQAAKLWDYLSEYDIVVKMNLANVDINYLKKYRKHYREEVERAKKVLDIDNQILRLIQFFKEV